MFHGRYDGRTKRPEYVIWLGIVSRCLTPSTSSWASYGGRGIKVCDRWRTSFEAFISDMGVRPSIDHSVDRIDNNGNYEPGNCRWATRSEQARNTRVSTAMTVNGTTRTIPDWSDLTGLPIGTLRARLRYGWSPERAVSTPPLIQRKRKGDVACPR